MLSENINIKRRSHSASHKLTGEVWVESIRLIFNLIQGLVGLDTPDISPDAKFLAAKVPVESRIC